MMTSGAIHAHVPTMWAPSVRCVLVSMRDTPTSASVAAPLAVSSTLLLLTAAVRGRRMLR